MPWTIPTLADLIARGRAAFGAELPGADLNNPRSNLTVTAKVLGGHAWGIYGRQERLARARHVHLSEGEDLDRHGIDLGMQRNPPAPARGAVTMTTATAAEMAVGGMLARVDGARYRVTAGATLASAGSATIQVEAIDAGAAGNLAASAVLTSLSGLTGSATFAVASGGLIGGVEREADGAYRARMLQRKRQPPGLGTSSDYWRWALEVDGVSDCYIWPRWNGAGTVRLYPIMDGLRVNGVPTSGDLAAVFDAVAGAMPDGADLSVAAFTPVPVDIEIGALSDNSAATREAIQAELKNMFAERSRVAGSATPHARFPMRATPFTFSRSWIGEAISRASGEVSHQLNEPSADIGLSNGERAVVGAVTFL